MTSDEHREEAAEARDGMGSKELARAWLMDCAPAFAGDERLEAQIARLDRHFMAPSTAAEWIQVESETDVTAVLSLLRCPTLVLDYEQSSTAAAQSRHVQARIPGAQLELISGDPYALPFGDRAQIVDVVQRFIGRERAAEASETVLGTVLFTDIVGSTEHQAAAGDRAWTEVVRRHHAIVRDALERWQGVENDTAGDGFYATFDGPARATRFASNRNRVGESESRSARAFIRASVSSSMASSPGRSDHRFPHRGHGGSGDVLVSRTVKDLTAGSGFSFDDRGEHELKESRTAGSFTGSAPER